MDKTLLKIQQKNIPVSWRVERFGDVFDFLSTATYSRDILKESGEVQYLHYGDIHTKYNFHLDFTKNNLPFITEIERRNYPYMKNGDLVLADASEDYDGVGKGVEIKNLGDSKAISGLHTFLLRDKDSNFVLGYKGFIPSCDVVREQFYRFATGTKVYSLSKESLSNVKVLIPPKEEQKAIADCLSTWDDAIEKQTKLIAAKEQRKKALMQQLLSGKKRLPGFEKKWKLHSIEELFIFKNGKAHENVIDEEGKFILINSKFISSNSQVVKRTNKNLSPLKIDDLVFVMSDVPKGKALGKFFYVDKDGLYTLNQRIGLLQIKTGNPKFMYYLLNRNRHFLSFDNGVGQTNLRKDDILECPLLIPDLDEQNEIANFISFIDREYQLELLKLDKLKTQKKGMMQKLLTGKIRLIA